MIKSGAPVLILITLLLVLYIIVLPPAEREALLGDGDTNGAGDGLSKGASDAHEDAVSNSDEFVFAGPGRIDVAGRSSYDHDLAPVHLSTTENAQVIFAENPFAIQSSVFKTTDYKATFSVAEPSQIERPLLTFDTSSNKGVLRIMLNGHQVFAGDIDEKHVGPIALPDVLLKANVLTFQVDSPGWAFWSTKRYGIENLRIQGDVVDTTRQSSLSTFSLKADEVNSLLDGTLSFVATCVQREVGRVRAYINDNLLFNQIPDCGIKNVHHFDRDILNIGVNTLEFSSTMGDVLLDAVEITTEIDEEANDVTYYFELDEDLFTFDEEEEEVCGEIDGFCPDNCDEDIDKDCCFEEYTNAYWCDMPTENSDDRCVGSVSEGTVFRCRSGYEDDDGRVPRDFRGICGDDHDNECPVGCSRFYDEDCCLEDGSGRFWCDDVPASGLIDVCRDDLPADSCRLCPDGYDGEDEDPRCSYDSRNPIRDEVELKSSYEVIAKFLFVDDDENKEAEVIVNGYTTNFDTYDDTYDKDISDFVKDGSNYITIRPQSDFSLVEVRIDVDTQ
jgi:hypothetical protein